MKNPGSDILHKHLLQQSLLPHFHFFYLPTNKLYLFINGGKEICNFGLFGKRWDTYSYFRKVLIKQIYSYTTFTFFNDKIFKVFSL